MTQPKKTTSSSGASSTTVKLAHTPVQAAKKRVGLKDKSGTKNKSTGKDGVLGGADYVAMLTGSRKKAREEGAKLLKE